MWLYVIMERDMVARDRCMCGRKKTSRRRQSISAINPAIYIVQGDPGTKQRTNVNFIGEDALNGAGSNSCNYQSAIKLLNEPFSNESNEPHR